jgi:hypothetical protein
MKRVTVTWRDDDGDACHMTMSAEMAKRCRALAKAKALPLSAVMEVLAERAYTALDKFLGMNGV